MIETERKRIDKEILDRKSGGQKKKEEEREKQGEKDRQIEIDEERGREIYKLEKR